MTALRSLGHPTADNRKVRVGGPRLQQQGRKAGQTSPFPILWVVICYTVRQMEGQRDSGHLGSRFNSATGSLCAFG